MPLTPCSRKDKIKMVVRLHHIEILCKNLQQRLSQFCGQFGFSVLAETSSSPRKRFAIKRDSIHFVLTENDGCKDTVFNVALEVKNVGLTSQRVERHGGKILKRLSTDYDSFGKTESAVIQSPVGNVTHTLLSSSNYAGVFLPGYTTTRFSRHSNINKQHKLPVFPRGADDDAFDPKLTHFDHLTFAVPENSSPFLLDWYEKCFGFGRFKINSEEEGDGFVIRSSVQGATIGMRLTAMEYWKCAEAGISLPTDDPGGSVKFVFAEPLPGQGSNQVQQFLDEHGSPGVQHIGLHTPDIIRSVSALKQAGVEFIDPPSTYYTENGKLDEMCQVGQCAKNLKDYGILLDAEGFSKPKYFNGEIDKSQENKSRYLMQVFTKPLFDENTFFLEVIERQGATGFGAGNIKALWRAVDIYLRENKEKLSKKPFKSPGS